MSSLRSVRAPSFALALALAASCAGPEAGPDPPPAPVGDGAARPSATAAGDGGGAGGAAAEGSGEPAAAPGVAGPKLEPVDEGPRDPAFLAFREELLEVVRRRDAEGLLARVDPGIRTSFGGGGGSEELRRSWEPGRADSPLWDELAWVLAHGGSFGPAEGGPQFWAPYVFSAWPEELDAFASLAVVEEGVPLREGPEAGAAAVATLAWDIVTARPPAPGEPPEPPGWRRVETADGRLGWVAADAVRSPIDYRAGFRREDGRWRMNALVAGD